MAGILVICCYLLLVTVSPANLQPTAQPRRSNVYSWGGHIYRPKPPYNEKLLKEKGILNTELTLDLCKRYPDVGKFTACKLALKYERHPQLKPKCPLPETTRWPRNRGRTRTKRSFSAYECPSVSSPWPISIMLADDNGQPLNLYHCINEGRTQWFYSNCPYVQPGYPICGLTCKSVCIRMDVFVIGPNNQPVIETVDIPDMTCCLGY